MAKSMLIFLGLVFVLFVGSTFATLAQTPSTASSPLVQTMLGGQSSRSRIRVGFGEACNKTARCKSGSWLTCDPVEERCHCMKPDEMVFDQGLQKCVGLIGERCKFGVGATEDESNTDAAVGNKWFEMTDCVEGAVCSETDGVCQCLPNFYEDIEANQCSQSKGHHSPCASQVECDSTKMLACLEGRCECFSAADMEYNSVENICKIKVGRNCKSLHELYRNVTPIITVLHGRIGEDNLNVIGNDAWLRIISSFESAKCQNGSSCSDSTGICSCPGGSYIDFDSASCLPVKGLEATCKSAQECNSTLFQTCLNDGRCGCDPDLSVLNLDSFSIPNPFPHYYSHQSSFTVPPRTCIKKVGQFCSVAINSDLGEYDYDNRYNPRSDNQYCVENADCVLNTCKCKDNLEITRDGMCGRGYDRDCSASSPCSDRFLCTSIGDNHPKTCQCPNFGYQTFDPTAPSLGGQGSQGTGSCRGLIGTPCDPKNSYSCISNAQCASEEEGSSDFFCECGTGFVDNSDKYCDIEHGHPCSYRTGRMDFVSGRSDRCDPKAGLLCKIVDGRKLQNDTQLVEVCQCPNNDDLYDGDRRKCVVPVNFACKDNEDCVTHASCVKRSGQESGRCKCAVGFIPTQSKSHKSQTCTSSTSEEMILEDDDESTSSTTTLDSDVFEGERLLENDVHM